jgi:hypothetical protein
LKLVLIQVFFFELLAEIIMVTVFLYTGSINTKKKAYNIIYGIQTYYYYVFLYPV